MLLLTTERPFLGLMPIKSSPDIIRFSINTIVTGFIMKRGKKKVRGSFIHSNFTGNNNTRDTAICCASFGVFSIIMSLEKFKRFWAENRRLTGPMDPHRECKLRSFRLIEFFSSEIAIMLFSTQAILIWVENTPPHPSFDPQAEAKRRHVSFARTVMTVRVMTDSQSQSQMRERGRERGW